MPKSRLLLIVPALLLLMGAGLGAYFATLRADPPGPIPESLQLGTDAQDDYILNIADAFTADGNLKLAQDRLARLKDPKIAARVEQFAIEYAPHQNASARNLISLAVALGSRNHGLVALIITATPPPTRTPPPSNAPVFSNVRATRAPTVRPSPTPADTQTPAYVVVPNSNPYIILPTNTPTITPTRRPATRVPTATITPTPTAVPPPPATTFEPGLDRWWGSIYFQAADVQPGQGYWHLAHAIYCDAFDGSDPHRHDFGCDEMPGGGAGTSIYVMSHGNEIDVIAPDGRNVADDPTIVGDKKKPGDMCDCDYAFESSNYRVSVRGAPSDAIGGFCLCGRNFGWGSRAHVRYFLYFEYITR